MQLDEPSLIYDLDSHHLEMFKKAYTALGAELSGIKVLIETYFADIPAHAYK